ncbi:MAG: hydroxylamine oxidoreductase [Candidatus Abyssobacteria bacterium SURF_5]|uniref:Hydroxylamine oxidoreductase n=1 Tax=Abyssobacteria bacterium (strain SURF_5) TaxID=2093360 RepID=A0A3A4NBD8_ABYX5|nr:MAG: hydroxylamine oxidoreductase [Candidatus Abyssubacteria bacterium SURF_5]
MRSVLQCFGPFRKIISLIIFFVIPPLLYQAAASADERFEDQSQETKKCIVCHEEAGVAPVIVHQWESSAHAANGVGCYECHQAAEGEADAFNHYDTIISTIVSPKDCGQCHSQETAEFDASHHARAGEILGSLDNVLGDVVEGEPAANSGCKQCHGSHVKMLANGKLDPATWPNTGIGRINPDGSKGSCAACHSRHSFSPMLARQPENCGKCHLGPDHPQYEIYTESKHGIAFRAMIDDMNLKSDSWVLGKDYFAAPTCASCHMSATKDMPLTHDVGTRISWTLRPAISNKLDNWEQRRENMQKVCRNCHAPDYVLSFYAQYDDVVELYNEKFAKPATAIVKKLADAGNINATPFDEEIEWTYFFLWHHEGRRARHGAAMMGPDYTQWHGFYEVAHRFYMEFVPQAEHLLPGVTQEFMAADPHQWTKGLSPEQREHIKKFYEERYGQ